MVKTIYHAQKGYVLVVTILLGFAVAIASSTFLQYVVNSSVQLTDETYTTLAEEAAEAGAVYAANCIGQYSANWTSLKPNINCDGVTQGNAYVSSATSGIYKWRSSFSVDPYYETTDNYTLTVHGKLDVLRNTTIVKTYDIVKTNLLSKQILRASTTQATRLQATALSVDTHSCLIANGKLFCWGANDRGQLGDSTTAAKSVPTQVTTSGFSSKVVTKVAVGTKNTCAIADDLLYCWGDNLYGQVGNNSATGFFSVPTLVTAPGSGRFTDIALSQNVATPGSVCGIVDGTGYCWGRNNMQQLGTSTAGAIDTATKKVPTLVNSAAYGGLKLTKISVGENNGCGLAVGVLVCWGGQASPTAPPQLMNGVAPYNYYADNVAVTGKTTCATITYFYHALSCHGQSNALPALATMTTSPEYLFNGLQVPPPDPPGYRPYEYGGGPFGAVKSMDSGFDASNGEIYCALAFSRSWCAGAAGAQTGAPSAGTPFAMQDAAAPSELNNFGSKALGYFHATSAVGAGNGYGCLLSNGSLFCWGKDTNGTLAGGPSAGPYPLPQRFASNTIPIGAQPNNSDTNDFVWTFTADGPLALGAHHACGIINSLIMCWGANASGQLGNGNTTSSNEPATSGIILQYGADKISAGGDHTCAVAQGSLFCWGDNSDGELGVATATLSKRVAPLEVAVKDSGGNKLYVTDVSVGKTNVCAIAGNAQIYCWGKNDQGQVGNGSVSGTNVTTPTLVTGGAYPAIGAATAISVGDNHVCAVINSEAYCWGKNDYNQVNATATVQVTSPTKVTATGAFTGISAGKNFTCGILNGVVNCWGANDTSQLSATASTKRATVSPIAAPGGTLLATSVSAGDAHACAVLRGATYCWGKNDQGQLGTGATSAPVVAPTKVTITDGATPTPNALVSVGVGAGGSTSCTVANGLIYCWGNNDSMQAGSTTITGPVLTPRVSQWYRYEINRNKGIFY